MRKEGCRVRRLPRAPQCAARLKRTVCDVRCPASIPQGIVQTHAPPASKRCEMTSQPPMRQTSHASRVLHCNVIDLAGCATRTA
ncbi:hypothetical protein Bxe_B0311 [Paraburkholderia xenovorans LB400]|uniref:Uncharacterized protein n=1 Tax=Paraburkholderia xenovorans (strain LB400) TaxID=266265 RepID=Q13JV4_PARXL|nr:hypothetical protein Bxe_B0311 [Paraburkholderia xenovorans LB400]